MHFKMASVKWWPFYLSLNVFNQLNHLAVQPCLWLIGERFTKHDISYVYFLLFLWIDIFVLVVGEKRMCLLYFGENQNALKGALPLCICSPSWVVMPWEAWGQAPLIWPGWHQLDRCCAGGRNLEICSLSLEMSLNVILIESHQTESTLSSVLLLSLFVALSTANLCPVPWQVIIQLSSNQIIALKIFVNKHGV